MKKRKQEIEEVEIVEEELSEKELKKRERKAGIEKRRKARQKDKVARFSGIILLGLVLLVGFLFWIAGETGSEREKPINKPIYQQTNTIENGNQDVIRVR